MLVSFFAKSFEVVHFSSSPSFLSFSLVRHGGPLGLLLGYMAVGSICYSVMVCLGELVSHLPVAGGHITLARRFVSPAFSFAMGYK